MVRRPDHLALHFDTSANKKRLRVFWLSFTGMFVYEVIPSYIFPLLNGFNIFCLASQHAPQRTRDVFTNLFGGSDGNEGLGFLSLSFDWQYIGSTYMSLPLIQQGAMLFLLLLLSSYLPSVSKFVDWICLVLHHTHGYLLLECLGGSSIYLSLRCAFQQLKSI